MKKFTVMFLLAYAHLSFANENPFSAFVFHNKGEVELSTGAGHFVPIEQGEEVAEGDVVKTGPRSYLILRFPDKSTMRVDPNSEVAIERLVERLDGVSLGSTDIILKAGRVIIDVINKSSSPVLNLRTKHIAMGVRGTRFSAGIDPETGHAEIAVNRGEVEVSSISNPDYADSIESGHAIHFEKGKNFTQPQRYNWVKKFNFDTTDKNLDHAKNDFVHEGKRREFVQKRTQWQRDPVKWEAKKKKWKAFREQHLQRAEELKEKRREFRSKKKQFVEKRDLLIAKRNEIAKESLVLRMEGKSLKDEKVRLLRDQNTLKRSRKDPRKKVDLARRKKNILEKSEALKAKRQDNAQRRKTLMAEKKELLKYFKGDEEKSRKIKRDSRKNKSHLNKKKRKILKKKIGNHTDSPST